MSKHGVIVTGAEDDSELAAYPDRRKPATGFVRDGSTRVTIRSTSKGATIDRESWDAFRDAVDAIFEGRKA